MRLSPNCQDREGPSEGQSFSETVKSRFTAVSTKLVQYTYISLLSLGYYFSFLGHHIIAYSFLVIVIGALNFS